MKWLLKPAEVVAPTLVLTIYKPRTCIRRVFEPILKAAERGVRDA